jgi:hypothetical protein
MVDVEHAARIFVEFSKSDQVHEFGQVQYWLFEFCVSCDWNRVVAHRLLALVFILQNKKQTAYVHKSPRFDHEKVHARSVVSQTNTQVRATHQTHHILMRLHLHFDTDPDQTVHCDLDSCRLAFNRLQRIAEQYMEATQGVRDACRCE